jgi:hypothetical protein
MISTFDFFLLGGLISLGGLVFLLRAYRPQSTGSPLDIVFAVMRSRDTGPNETRQRAEAMAGVRWLTVGALALFMGNTRGSDSGYLFDFWADLMFHTALLSGCWVATAFRINRNRTGETPALRPVPATNSPASPISPQALQE